MSDGTINRSRRSRASGWRSHPDVVELRVQSSIAGDTALAAFIATARADNPLDVVDWDANYWEFPDRSRGSSSGEGGLHFSRTPATKGTAPESFPDPYLGFVKAVVCRFEQRSAQGFAASGSQTLIAACRWLFQQLEPRGVDPTELTHGDFDAAAKAAESSMGEGAANIGSKLAFVANQLDHHAISVTPIDWRNTVKRKGKHDGIGPEADRRRLELMPSTDVLDCLADLSSRSDLDDRETIIQRVIDLLVCTGFRINEALTLPRECLVEEAEVDDLGEPVLDRYGAACTRLGIRYWPEKGYQETLIKWIPSVMADIARRAIADILRITEPYWQLARFQRANPGKSLLGSPWDELSDDEQMSSRDLEAALGLVFPGGTQFITHNDIPFERINKKAGEPPSFYVKKGDLLARLYDKSQHGNVLRKGEGTQDLSDCLFLIPLRYMHTRSREGVIGTVALLKDAQVNVYLVGLDSQPSIFERRGYKGEDGEYVRATSHQFRHWLTTLALEGGLHDAELARWMGRANLAHNSSYDHRTPAERARRVADRLRADETLGPVADTLRTIKDPVRREEFIKSHSETAHVTDLGICVHPWDTLPCQKHGDCSDCGELRVEKGNSVYYENAKLNLAHTEDELRQAEWESADDTYGADPWIKAHERTINTLKKIVHVHEDDSIPDGYLVQIKPDAAPVE